MSIYSLLLSHISVKKSSIFTKFVAKCADYLFSDKIHNKISVFIALDAKKTQFIFN